MTEFMDSFENNEMEVPEKMNVLARLGNLIFSPKKLFLFLREKPSILFPLILLIVGTLGYQLILWDHTKDLLLDTLYNTYNSMGMSMTLDQLEQMANMQMIWTLVGTPLTIVFMWAITTLIMYAAFRFVNCEKGMKKYFSMTAYITILTVIGMILNALFIRLAGGDMTTQVTSLSSMLNADSIGIFLYGFAANIEVFNIWAFILYGIGFIYIGGVEKNKVIVVTIVLFVLFALVSAGMMSLSNSLTGGLTGGSMG